MVLSRSLALATAVCLAPLTALSAETGSSPIPLTINNSGNIDPAGLYHGLNGVNQATVKSPGRFTWDVGRHQILNPIGDLVATIDNGPLESQLARVQGTLDKWTVVRALEQDTDHQGLTLRVEPDDPIHRRGSSITLVISGMRHPYFTLFNLAADGTINFVYPATSTRLHDSPTLASDTPYRLELQVVPPFGADHFIAISSTTALTDLHANLRANDGKSQALAVLDWFERFLPRQTYQLGVFGVFSGP